MELDAVLRWAELAKGIAGPDRLAIVLAMIWVESRGEPDVVNVRSGAVGLMQVMPYEPKKTGETFAGRPDPGELLKPEVNVEWGFRILKYYMKREKGLWKALYQYSGGKAWVSYEDFNKRYWMPFSEVRGEIEAALR